MSKAVIVGIGNPYRGDDAAGWAVIDALEKRGASANLCKKRGDVAQLIDIFEKHPHVVLVDACNGDPGKWFRIDIHKQPLNVENNQTSTHGLSVKEAIALAKNLNVLPLKLIIYAIAGNQYQMSEGMSPKISKAIEDVVEAIFKEEISHA